MGSDVARVHPPRIEANQASFGYGPGAFALAPVELVLEPASFTVVFGPNGSGKSTLVRMLGGLTRPVSGRVLWNGRDASAFSARERGRTVAFVTQDEPRRVPFTVFDTVMMGRFPHQGLWPFDSAADVDAAHAAMERLDVARFAARLLDDLSSGERQRVYLARALAQRPSLLFLDEPAANLDLAHQVSLYRLLAELNCELGLTIVAVSHELNIAKRAATNACLLRDGKIVGAGAPENSLTPALLSETFGHPVRSLRDQTTGLDYFVPGD